MKQLYFLTFLFATFSFLNPFQVNSQELNYSLTVLDKNQQPKPNVEITLIETSTFQRKVFRTNAQGQANIVLNEGAEWVMNIGDMKNYEKLYVSPYGNSSGSALATYNVERWNRMNQPPVNRSKLNIVEVPQTIKATDQPDQRHSILEIALKSEEGKIWRNIPVKMTCIALEKSFTTVTDAQGIARFKVPLNQSYQIDVDGEDDFEYYDMGNQPFKSKMTLTFNKINFSEKANDQGYLVQTFTQAPEPVSNRVMVTLQVRGGSNNGANENVYLEMAYSNKKYKGKTDENGQVIFLLPKKRNYRVSFDYHKDAGVLDLTRFFGIGEMSTGVYYNPDPRLEFPERYLPSSDDIKSYDINNGLTTRYPDTDGDELLNVHVKWGNNKINSGSKEALLELGFSVKEPKDKKQVTKPLNIAFVLDKSGSMAGENIDILKAAMMEFIDKLRPQDKVSIVFFDTEAVVAYPSANPQAQLMKDLVGAAQASGGTSIFNGLELGYKEVDKNRMDNSINRIILLTDGYGSKPVDYILEQSADYFKKGIAVSTIGVGVDYNHSLLSLLSQYSGGLEHQALESEGISKALEAEFESLLYPLASDLKVKVKYNNRVVYKTLYGIPEKRNSDGMVHFELGRVYSSLNKMALMKFKIENPDRDIDKNKITIEITYFDEQKQEEVKIIKETNLEWTDETDIEMIHDEQLKSTYSIAVINQVMKVIADLCENGDYAAAKETINETLKSLKRINGDKYSEELIPIVEQLKTYLIYLDRAIRKG